MILGIHHVTAIASHPQPNVDFYVGVLGLRLVKQTVNFDDPGVYHLYYGDGVGSPGTLLTFFPYGDILPGKRGRGETISMMFEVPPGSLDWWCTHLSVQNIPNGIETIFGRQVVWALDHDGMRVELEEADGPTEVVEWKGSIVPTDKAIRRIKRLTLAPNDFAGIGDFRTTEDALTGMFEAEKIGREGTRTRYRLGDSEVDVYREEGMPRAQNSAGTVHHVAFRNASPEIQEQWLMKLMKAGFHTSPVTERDYFKSIYFREPGGVLFEFATDGPGFQIDEDEPTLGTHLKLPSRYEPLRPQLQVVLPKLNLEFGQVV
ncbi:MAG: ring-cleaving dioxygenase [Armatimonadetes bacterium]|nr:ring-cleaving dioxygenase [Armatimonadota bacterium]